MPIYEYKCRDCEQAFEQLVKSMSGKSAIHCPSCNSRKVERQLSLFAAQAGQNDAMPMGASCQDCGQAGGSCPYQG